MRISEIRKRYHKSLFEQLIRIKKNSQKGDYPNNADGDSRISVKIAWELIENIGIKPMFGNFSGQAAGKTFEVITKDFIKNSFKQLNHIRPGKWTYAIESEISNFEQYRDLFEIHSILLNNKKLASTFGQDYIIKPDIIIGRLPLSDDEINKHEHIVDGTEKISSLTSLRKENLSQPKPTLHASISCKWTLRSDRAQNIRTEALNLIRNRKGKLPHIIAVTAEPTLTRIASLALGTGDLDCVYHFALHELEKALISLNEESQLDMYNILVEGRRLRDISDLPFDLAI